MGIQGHDPIGRGTARAEPIEADLEAAQINVLQHDRPHGDADLAGVGHELHFVKFGLEAQDVSEDLSLRGEP